MLNFNKLNDNVNDFIHNTDHPETDLDGINKLCKSVGIDIKKENLITKENLFNKKVVLVFE